MEIKDMMNVVDNTDVFFEKENNRKRGAPLGNSNASKGKKRANGLEPETNSNDDPNIYWTKPFVNSFILHWNDSTKAPMYWDKDYLRKKVDAYVQKIYDISDKHMIEAVIANWECSKHELADPYHSNINYTRSVCIKLREECIKFISMQEIIEWCKEVGLYDDVGIDSITINKDCPYRNIKYVMKYGKLYYSVIKLGKFDEPNTTIEQYLKHVDIKFSKYDSKRKNYWEDWKHQNYVKKPFSKDSIVDYVHNVLVNFIHIDVTEISRSKGHFTTKYGDYPLSGFGLILSNHKFIGRDYRKFKSHFDNAFMDVIKLFPHYLIE